jgi:hypothetical protein
MRAELKQIVLKPRRKCQEKNRDSGILPDWGPQRRPHVWGAKLLGAGGGGFLLMVCKSPEDAAAVRRMLEKRPPNDKARFFDYSISRAGLVVTVC